MLCLIEPRQKNKPNFQEGKINVNIYLETNYNNTFVGGPEKTKPINQPLAGNSKHETLNPKLIRRGCCVKQTQYLCINSVHSGLFVVSLKLSIVNGQYSMFSLTGNGIAMRRRRRRKCRWHNLIGP